MLSTFIPQKAPEYRRLLFKVKKRENLNPTLLVCLDNCFLYRVYCSKSSNSRTFFSHKMCKQAREFKNYFKDKKCTKNLSTEKINEIFLCFYCLIEQCWIGDIFCFSPNEWKNYNKCDNTLFIKMKIIINCTWNRTALNK